MAADQGAADLPGGIHADRDPGQVARILADAVDHAAVLQQGCENDRARLDRGRLGAVGQIQQAVAVEEIGGDAHLLLVGQRLAEAVEVTGIPLVDELAGEAQETQQAEAIGHFIDTLPEALAGHLVHAALHAQLGGGLAGVLGGDGFAKLVAVEGDGLRAFREGRGEDELDLWKEPRDGHQQAGKRGWGEGRCLTVGRRPDVGGCPVCGGGCCGQLPAGLAGGGRQVAVRSGQGGGPQGLDSPAQGSHQQDGQGGPTQGADGAG